MSIYFYKLHFRRCFVSIFFYSYQHSLVACSVLDAVTIHLHVVVDNAPGVCQILGEEAQVQNISGDGHVRHPLGRLTDAVESAEGRGGDGKSGVGLVVLVQGGHELLLGGQPLGLGASTKVTGKVHADAAVQGAEPDDVNVWDLSEDGIEVVDTLELSAP